MSAALTRRRRRSLMATIAVTLIACGPAVFVAARLLGLGPATLRPTDLIVVPWAGLALATVVAVLAQRGRPGRIPLVPRRAARELGRLVELSEFGVGGLRDWTVTNPQSTLERQLVLVCDAPEMAEAHSVSADLSSTTPLAPIAPTGGSARHTAVPTPGELGEAADTTWTGPTDEHTVERGDTWWTLADKTLDDGRRWRTLVELNRGREVAPGITVGDETVLRRGWQIALPRQKEKSTS